MTGTNFTHHNSHIQTSLPPLALRQQDVPPTITILRLPDVMRRVGLKHAAIYQMIAQGNFPKQIPLGARAVGWLESEIDAWLAWRVQHARGLTPP